MSQLDLNWSTGGKSAVTTFLGLINGNGLINYIDGNVQKEGEGIYFISQLQQDKSD